MFLLVCNVVLGASNDTSFLNTLDGFVDSNTGEHGVRREALPVAAACGMSADGSNGGTKLDVDALLAVLDTHVVTTKVEQVTIPRGANGHAGREGGDKVGEAHTQR